VLNRRTAFVRALLASAAIAAAFALASCETDGSVDMTRAMKPLSPELVAALEQKHMPKESPILVRIFKEEAELEVWKQDDTGRFALLKTFPICRWSGDLGPKIREGDRQAPEGFYTITPGQMNPNSNYYLSFNLGFPNAYDKANDRTGAFLMVHGDCSSAGCYAMTDEQMGEIYALGRESFFGGQRSFQVQAYPFHMTPLNLAKHRNSPHMAFWRMIKQGNDHFEVTGQEPKVDVCDKHYVFDAVPPQGSATPLSFTPKGRCPVFEIAPDVATAVKEKHDNDEREFATLVSRGTPTVASRSNIDGGMNPVFAAKLKPTEIFDGDGRVRTFASAPAPGTIPPTVNPPQAADTVTGSAMTADVAVPRGTPQHKTGSVPAEEPAVATKIFGGLFTTASTDSKSVAAPDARHGNSGTTPAGEQSGGDNPLGRMTSTVSKWVGLGGSEPQAPEPSTAQVATTPKPKAKPVQTAAAPAALTRPRPPQHQPAQATQVAPTQAPQTSVTPLPAAQTPAADPQQQIANVQPAAPAPTGSSVMMGAQPLVPASSFDSRWGATR
jgi:murein L,D-transpeptidase YafK